MKKIGTQKKGRKERSGNLLSILPNAKLLEKSIFLSPGQESGQLPENGGIKKGEEGKPNQETAPHPSGVRTSQTSVPLPPPLNFKTPTENVSKS